MVPDVGTVLASDSRVDITVNKGVSLHLCKGRLRNKYANLDVDADGYISWEEVNSVYPGIPGETFDLLEEKRMEN